jgi:hypothetical protein
MQFGLYLKKKGIISAEQLVAALEVQQKQLVRIGQLAIEEGFLTPREVFQVLRSQSDSPHERFGELAVGLELMTRPQLQQLLVLQMDRKRPLCEVLVAQHAISPLQRVAELAEFRHEKEGRKCAIRRPVYASSRNTISASVRNSRPDGQFATGI